MIKVQYMEYNSVDKQRTLVDEFICVAVKDVMVITLKTVIRRTGTT